MDLSGNQLNGSLATSWGAKDSFGALTSLDLSNNSFTGALPPSWGNSSFRRLTKLSLEDNGVSGTLPPAWSGPGQWPVLAMLSIQGNDLTGKFPDCLSDTAVFAALSTGPKHHSPNWELGRSSRRAQTCRHSLTDFGECCATDALSQSPYEGYAR